MLFSSRQWFAPTSRKMPPRRSRKKSRMMSSSRLRLTRFSRPYGSSIGRSRTDDRNIRTPPTAASTGRGLTESPISDRRRDLSPATVRIGRLMRQSPPPDGALTNSASGPGGCPSGQEAHVQRADVPSARNFSVRMRTCAPGIVVPTSLVWRAREQRRRAGWTRRGDLGRYAEMPEDPADDGRLLDERDQTRAGRHPSTSLGVEPR